MEKPFVVHGTQQIPNQILIFIQAAKRKTILAFHDPSISSVYSNPPETAYQTYAEALQASSETLTTAQSKTMDCNTNTCIDDLLKASTKKNSEIEK